MDSSRKKNKKAVSEISEELGLSASTVYNVISNRVPVSEKVRQSVAECAEKLGYDIFTPSNGEHQCGLRIVAAIPSMPSPFWNKSVAGIGDAMKKYDMTGIDFRLVRFSKLRGEDETLRMLDIIEKMSPDACIVVPCSSDKVRDRLSSLSGKMLTAIIDEPLDCPGLFITATGNYAQDGTKAAEIISGFPIAKKKIVVIDTEVTTYERIKAFYDKCKSLPDIEIAGSVSVSGYSKTFASELSRKLASLGNGFNCIYVPSGLFGPVCLSVQKLGLGDCVYVVGHDASPSVTKYFENGFKGAVIRQDIYSQSFVAASAVMDKLLFNEKNYPVHYDTGYSSEIFI